MTPSKLNLRDPRPFGLPEVATVSVVVSGRGVPWHGNFMAVVFEVAIWLFL